MAHNNTIISPVTLGEFGHAYMKWSTFVFLVPSQLPTDGLISISFQLRFEYPRTVRQCGGTVSQAFEDSRARGLEGSCARLGSGVGRKASMGKRVLRTL